MNNKGINGSGLAHLWGKATSEFATKKEVQDVLAGTTPNPQIFNVKSFGSVGNGQTDDSSAIQSAIDACHTTGGGVIYFPFGVYLLNSCIYYYSNMTLFFENGATLLRGRSSLKCLLSNYVGSDVTGYNGTDNVHIIGATLDGNVSFVTASTDDYKVTLLLSKHAKNIVVENCTFKNGNVWHFYEINAAENVKVINCIFDGSSYGGTSSQIDTYAELLQLDNDYIVPGTVSETLVTSGDLTPCKNIHIKGCKFICNGYCNAIGNHNAQTYNHSQIRISDCYFVGGGGTGRYIDFDASTVDVDIYNNTFDGDAVTITATNSNTTIHDNRVQNSSIAYVGSGSYIAYGNLVNGIVDGQGSDDVMESIDFNAFGTMRTGDTTYGSATLSSANIKKYRGRIMGVLKFDAVTTNSNYAILPVKVNAAYRPKLTSMCVAEYNSSGKSAPGVGYLSSGSETLRVTFSKALSGANGVSLYFDYAI